VNYVRENREAEDFLSESAFTLLKKTAALNHELARKKMLAEQDRQVGFPPRWFKEMIAGTTNLYKLKSQS
jgi:hypothetical protein